MLPIVNYREKIVILLARSRKFVLTAPPGAGKSTQIPQFFADQCSPEKRLLMLEPRRIAARSLAYRVAEEMGVECGGAVGYQVRFERKTSEKTKILFLTYGTFLQMLLNDPEAVGSSIIVFDEFHERSLESDTALAWVRLLQQEARHDLGTMVLSATLEKGPLFDYLKGAVSIDIEDRAFPVDIRYQPPRSAGEPLSQQVERALGGISGGRGSVLVFMPGFYEIERVAETLHDQCRRNGYCLLRLHGRMPLHEQQEVLRRPAQEPCVILSTNVAETSLTVPGVTAVIDSGLARIAAFDSERERNTLYLRRISLQNAAQRSGRAGRLAPGICIRLWSREDERAMQEALPPEILRLGLAKTVLTLSAYAASQKRPGKGVVFLTPPPTEQWNAAYDELLRYKAISRSSMVEKTDGYGYHPHKLTELGRAMSRLPLEPSTASVLLKSSSHEVRSMNMAMAAVLEGRERESEGGQDLFSLAEAFFENPESGVFRREMRESYEQLERLMEKETLHGKQRHAKKGKLRKEVAEIWMNTFSHRTGVRNGESPVYSFADGRNARLALKRTSGAELRYPDLLIALQVHEQAGRGQFRKAEIPLYLPLDAAWIGEAFPDEVKVSAECRWDAERERVIIENLTRFRGMAIKREECLDRRPFREQITACLAEQFVKGVWEWRKEYPKAEQFAYRVRQVSSVYPEMRIPSMDAADWELVYHGLCEGKSTLGEVKKNSMMQAVKEYIGRQMAGFVERKAPDIVLLPSGRKGRITYFENAPPELSARLGDLIGHKDTFMLMDGRVQGIFNVLAPNFRTLQKTADLGSFWKNVYPAIKSQLKRKYPKHPWP